MYKELKNIRDIINKKDISIKEHMNGRDRRRMAKQIPDSFLEPKGIPTYQIREPNGAISLKRLKKSLAAAKANYTRTKDERYKNHIDQINIKIGKLVNKTNILPVNYELPSTGVTNILNKTIIINKK